MKSFKAKVLDITQGRFEVFLNETVAREMDLQVLDRVCLKAKKRVCSAILDTSHSLPRDEIGLYAETAEALRVKNGGVVRVSYAPKPVSLDFVRKKLDGDLLEPEEIKAIIIDLMQQNLSPAELSAFISAVYMRGLSTDETVALTNAIFESGGSLHFKNKLTASVHSIGGVAGDRVSMLVAPILASMGLVVPKTCTRAISSASGTADAMECLAPVDLPLSKVKRVIAETGACIVWGGAVNMAAADDLLIKIRRPLRLDPESLVLASVLAKKKAEGAKFILIDLPVGRDAKIEDRPKATKLAKEFESMGNYLGINVKCAITDGSEPTISQIGPVFEARAVLEALSGKNHKALMEKSCLLAGILLSMAKGVSQEEGYHMALQRIESGRALEKFREIIKAQGGRKNVKPEDLRLGKIRKTIRSKETGVVGHVSNKALSRIARALGAPVDRHAGIVLHAVKDDRIKPGDALFDLYADSQEKMSFALKQLESTRVVEIQRILLDVV